MLRLATTSPLTLCRSQNHQNFISRTRRGRLCGTDQFQLLPWNGIAYVPCCSSPLLLLILCPPYPATFIPSLLHPLPSILSSIPPPIPLPPSLLCSPPPPSPRLASPSDQYDAPFHAWFAGCNMFLLMGLSCLLRNEFIDSSTPRVYREALSGSNNLERESKLRNEHLQQHRLNPNLIAPSIYIP